MPAFELRLLPLSELTPAEYNPRRALTPRDPAYRKLVTSLREFGLVEPLVWNESTGHIVGGHLRLTILRELGATEVPVSVVRLTPARERALNVVLNNREAQGRFDPTKLADLLDELADLPELDLTGFDADTAGDLRLEPLGELPTEEVADRVTVAIECATASFEQWRGKLDELVREFDLTCHVRQG